MNIIIARFLFTLMYSAAFGTCTFAAPVDDSINKWVENRYVRSFISPPPFDAGPEGAFKAYREADSELSAEALPRAIKMLRGTEPGNRERRLGLIGVISLLQRKYGSPPDVRYDVNAIIARDLKSAVEADDTWPIFAILEYYGDFGSPNVRQIVVPLLNHSFQPIRQAAKNTIDSLRLNGIPEEPEMPPEPDRAKGPPEPVRPDPVPEKEPTVTVPPSVPNEASKAIATSPSSAFLWTGAGVAMALLVGLGVFWKRRV